MIAKIVVLLFGLLTVATGIVVMCLLPVGKIDKLTIGWGCVALGVTLVFLSLRSLQRTINTLSQHPPDRGGEKLP